MRDIEFRGKTFTNNWIFGSFVSSENLPPAIYFEVGEKYKRFDWGVVRHETVGQYTGLLDRNKVKIFEGDIVRVSLYDNSKIVPDSEEIIGSVVFQYGEYTLQRETKSEIKIYTLSGVLEELMCNYEVIGNIHDNPELLRAN